MKEHVIISRDRTVVVPESLKKIGIQFDHNVNTITFDCPRYPDEDSSIDMSKMPIFINYMLPDKTPGSSLALNVVVDETDDTLMHFDWKITNAITPVNGVLSTLICVKQSDTEGNELYHWNTDLFQKFTVGNGMECNGQVAEMNPDVITQLLARMGEVDTRTSTEAMSGYVNEYMTENPPQPTDEQASAGINTYMAFNGQTHVNAYMTENQELVQNSVDDYLGRNPLHLDDSLTDSTKAAPADKVGELKGDLVDVQKNFKCNMYKLSTWTVGKISGSDGSEVSSNYGARCDFFEVGIGDKIINKNDTSKSYYAFYSASKTFEYVDVLTAELTFDNNGFIRIWYNNSDYIDMEAVIQIAKNIYFVSVDAIEHAIETYDEKIIFNDGAYNLFDVSECTIDKIRNGSTIISIDDGFISNRFAVSPNKVYKTNYPITWINYLTQNGALKRKTSGEGQYVITPSADEYFVEVSGWRSNCQLETFIISEVSNEDEDPSGYALAISNKEVNAGKLSLALSRGYDVGEFEIGNNYEEETDFVDILTNKQKMIALSIVGEYEGIIKNIKTYVSGSGILTFGIGLIDQRGWGLIREYFDATITDGMNDLSTNVAIQKGERLFICSSSTENTKVAVKTNGYHYESDSDGMTMSMFAGCVCVSATIDGKKYLDSPVAKQIDLSNVKQDVSELTASLNNKKLTDFYMISAGDNYFKLTVSDDGTLGTSRIEEQGKILIMGNSYDVHDYVPGHWFGDFGMCASRKENDWKHLLLNRLFIENDLLYSFSKQSLAGWETNWTDFDYSTLDSSLSDTYSMIIIRIGENNTDTDQTENQTRMYSLLNYINQKTGGNIPIVVGGSVKYRTDNNQAFKNAVDAVSNATWVDMESAGKITPFSASLDYRVFGDDGIWHTVSESSMASSVAYHPNDNVMKAMCDLLYPTVLEKLTSSLQN